MLKSINKRSFNALWLLIAGILFFAAAEIVQVYITSNQYKALSVAQNKIEEGVEKLSAELTGIRSYKTEDALHDFLLHKDHSKNGFYFYVFIDNELRYWSDKQPVVDRKTLDSLGKGSFVSLPNGDFIVRSVSFDDRRKAIGLFLIKHRYQNENKYLQNSFNPYIGLNNFIESKSGKDLVLPDGTVYGKFAPKEELPVIPITTTFYLIGFLLFGAGYYLLILYSFRKSFLSEITSIIVLLLLRFIMIFFRIPEEIYNLDFFSPTLYASSFLYNSPGDILFNSVILIISIIPLRLYSPEFKNLKVPAMLLFLLAGWGMFVLVKGVVLNSTISFDVSNPEEISGYSILFFFVLSLSLITFALFFTFLLRSCFHFNIRQQYSILFLLALVIATTFEINYYEKEKEYANRKLIAEKVDLRQDNLAEYIFENAERKMLVDYQLEELIEKRKQENVRTYLFQKYFSGYLSRFDISLALFDSAGFSLSGGRSLEEFRSIAAGGKRTYSQKLTFIQNESGQSYYLAILPLTIKSKPVLVLTLTSTLFRSEEGFPELFAGDGVNRSPVSVTGYSVAKYRNSSLLYEYGNFVYSLSDNQFADTKADFSFIESDGYSHLLYRPANANLIVVSKPAQTFLNRLTLFSWLICFTLITAFVVFFWLQLSGYQKWEWTLTRRIQVSVIFLVVFSFVLIGTGTVFYINKRYENDQRKSISDQVNALWFQINRSIVNPNDTTSSLKEQINQFDRLVNATNIDFNIYNSAGELFYSSQPRIFDQGIISTFIDPEAYFEIRLRDLTQFIHPETAGSLKYIAAYAPLTNAEGKLTGFLNVPYLEKQNELNKEISAFLSALLNIYILLFALAVLITLFISARITKPLILLQERMSGITLGKGNEKIAYKAQDEIGRLVNEYNRMLEQLERSAEKLAQSERESAWREMARQVAHEIKNPLTPMKLSIQHLERTVRDQGVVEPAVIYRLSQNLIQQIDTLSNIASAFGDFAKMPQSQMLPVDLKGLLVQLKDLFSELGNSITLNAPLNQYMVTGDRDQLLRIFTNLIKNAVQAIPENREGRIAINIDVKNGEVEVAIADNGIGISEDQKDKIFKPNFTTKSSGMGLGLAMVKNMTEQMNGRVWFSTQYNTGTTFFISFPVHS